MLFWGKGGSRRIAGLDAPSPARGQGLQPYGALDYFGWRADGVQGASGKPPARSAERCPCGGLTRRLRRGLGLAVPRGVHTFLSVAKEKCAKESQRHGDSGKKPFMPIFERGSSQCRAQHSWIANIYVRARSCSLFSSFKKDKAFSLRCLLPLFSPAVGGGHTHPLQVGMLRCSWEILQRG